MKPVEYVFDVDVFTPRTIPMARLAEYMAALARLLGNQAHTHFVRMDEGSARLVHVVEAVDAPKVEMRLREVAIGIGAREARKGYEALDNLLAEDNAVGRLELSATGAVIIPFPGRERPRPLVFPTLWQDGSIDGQLVSIGGRDETAHAILQDTDTVHSGLTLRRDLARELAPLIYGERIRVFGRGRWERLPEGRWRVNEFRVDRYEVLDPAPLGSVLAKIRNLPNNRLASEHAYKEMLARLSDDEAHH